MQQQDMQKLEELFHAAMELSGDDRERFVADSCRDRPDLREPLKDLLAAANATRAVVDTPAIKLGPIVDEPLPGQIGPYRILEVLGEGGMGTVYLAEQTSPVKRRVALKLIKLGMDTKQVVARFESERQALAMMNHPNVAAVYDGGATEQGRPYFVMEYVPGEPITAYCDKHKLSLPARLDLFMQVCHAIQHAHQKGIIHRDIKPSNVLVTHQDGKPLPKVIDFGVAKATDQRLTEKTVFTEQGQLIGTPAYMSPEQAAGSRDIDTRTDVYSLGVLLYQVLVGVTPFDSKSLAAKGYAELQRVIREVDPPKPSARLSLLAHEASDVANRRGTNTRTLTRGIRGDLDWITMKALEKSADRRYPTPLELAEDLKRFLAHKPVSAGPPILGYRVRCFLRRNGTAVLTALLATAVVIAGVTFGVTASIRASREQAISEQRRQTSEYRGYLRNVVNADRASVSYFPALAERLLASCPPHLRGWEWRFLSANTRDKSLSLFEGLRFPASLHLLNDGRHLLTIEHKYGLREGQISSTARVFDLYSGILMQELQSEGRFVVPLGVERHGLVIEHLPGKVRVWDAMQNRKVVQVEDPKLRVAARVPAYFYKESLDSSLSSDGKRLATLMSNGSIEIRDLDTGTVRANIEQQRGRIDSLSFAPTGSILLTSSNHKQLQFWDTESRQQVAAFEQKCKTARYLWSSSGRLVVIVGAGVHVWDWREERKILSLPKARFPTMSSDEERLAVLERGDVRIYSLDSGNLDDVFKISAAPYRELCFSPDGTLLTAITTDRLINVWNVRTGQLEKSVSGHADAPWCTAFTADGRYLISAESDLRIWPMDRLVSAWEPPPSDSMSITTFAISANGKFVLAKRGGQTWYWEVGAPSPPRKAGPGMASTDISSDGRFVLGYDRGNKLVLWATEPPHRAIRLAGHKERIIKARFSPSGDRFASASWDKTARVWSVDSLEEIHVLRGHTDHVYDVVFSPDGRTLATASRDGTARIWDANTGACRLVFDGHRKDLKGGAMPGLYSVSFSPDGMRVASGSSEGIIRIWNAHNGEQLFELHGHAGIIDNAIFSPDGFRIASGSGDGTIRLWDATTGQDLLVMDLGRRKTPACAWSPDGEQLLVYSKVMSDNLPGVIVFDTETPSVRYREKILFSEAGQRAAKIVASLRSQGSSWLEVVSKSYEDETLSPDEARAIRELVLLESSAERRAAANPTSGPSP